MAKRVLVVDNHPMMVSFLEEIVAAEGYDVRTAGDGVSAISALHDFNPEILITDLVMPNIDGRKLCQIVRALPEFRDIVIIVLSAIAREEPEDPERIGADMYIAKGPLDKMQEHIKEALERAPDKSSHQPEIPEIIGLGDVYAREITIELLSLQRHAVAVLDHMSDAIITVDRESRIVFANRRALLLTGKAEETLLGQPLSVIDLRDGEAGTDAPAEARVESLDANRIYAIRNTLLRLTIVSLQDSLQDVWVLMLKDETQQIRYERELKAAVGEKELLLRELQHRVSNNLSTIASMVNLQRNHMQDSSCRDSLGKLHAHVESIMGVPAQLRNSGGVGGIDLQSYIPSLVDNVVGAADSAGRLDVSVAVATEELSVKKAIPLGMIVSELVTNSVKHAYPDGSPGKITVSIERDRTNLVIEVADAGGGHSATPSDGDQLGLTIIETLAEQLEGEILFDWTKGARATLTFPAE